MFRTRIREVRKGRNMTQEALAQAVGCSRENISRYENGQRNPTAYMLFRIAKVLSVKVDELKMDDDPAIPSVQRQ